MPNKNHRAPMMVANWKMHKTAAETTEYFLRLRKRLDEKPTAKQAVGEPAHECFVVVAPAFPSLGAAVDAARGAGIAIAGQNLHWAPEGAFTGEVSGPMLAAAGCTYVIVGHSERRQGCGETDELVHKKIRAALASQLTPIVCVGETEEQRTANETEMILRHQFERAFWGMPAEELRHCVLAYEPVWAIGTGNTASPEVAEGAHRFLRRLTGDIFGPEAGAGISILYGGSMQPDNTRALLAQPDVDGGLVGSASLDADDFAAMCAIASHASGRQAHG